MWIFSILSSTPSNAPPTGIDNGNCQDIINILISEYSFNTWELYNLHFIYFIHFFSRCSHLTLSSNFYKNHKTYLKKYFIYLYNHFNWMFVCLIYWCLLIMDMWLIQLIIFSIFDIYFKTLKWMKQLLKWSE